MKNILDISKKLNSEDRELLVGVKKGADKFGVSFFIIGASARDFVLQYCYDIVPIRATEDIDIGVMVYSWKQFNDLKKYLLENEGFSETARVERVKYKNVYLDIVPFGGIEGKGKTFRWPANPEKVMKTMGFEEAYKYSIDIRIDQKRDIIIKVSSLPGLAVMKLISWKDRYPDRKRDAEDVLTIMNNYEYTDIYNRLYDKEMDLIKKEDHDVGTASIRLLGKDMRKVSNDRTKNEIIKILDNNLKENSGNELALAMSTRRNTLDSIDNIIKKISKLREGFVRDTG